MARYLEDEFDWATGSTAELVVELVTGAGRGTADAAKAAGEPDVAEAVKLASC